MDICLISPPTVTEISERQLASKEVYRLMAEYAPLGILSLAAVLERQGLAPRVVDLNQLYYDHVTLDGGERAAFIQLAADHLESRPTDVYGFSTICSSYPLTLRLAREMKRRCPEATVVLGGPQASVVDVQTMREFDCVDFVLRGEAEVTLPQLLEVVSRGRAGAELVGGLTYRDGAGGVTRRPNAPVVTDLDGLPMPAYHLYPRIRDCRKFPLEAGRGCPFACTFCSTNDFFRRRYRLKSPRVLVEQMRLLKQDYGARSFDLIHDMFTVDRKKVLAFCEAVAESGEGFRWNCSARTDCLDEGLLEAMARAGCENIFFGIDAGSERMQAVLDKGLDLGEAAARIARASRLGVGNVVSLITGFPEETEDDLRATARFFGESLRYPKTTVQLHLLAPLAETPVTTHHREQLVYDEIFSDISFQGWEQAPEDRALIAAHRDIFTNFYAIPTRWLDRRYLMEMREFLLRGVARHRRLMTFLHQDSGDLSRVFDEWLMHAAARRRAADGPAVYAYYRGHEFTVDLLDFVRSRYPEVWGSRHLAATLAEVEAAAREGPPAPAAGGAAHVHGARTAPSADSVPVLSGNARLIRVSADYRRLMRCLRRRGRLDRIPAERVSLVLLRAGRGVKIVQPSRPASRLLDLCDGQRSLLEVARSFAPDEEVGGVPAEKAGLFGVLALSRQGLIELREAAA